MFQRPDDFGAAEADSHQAINGAEETEKKGSLFLPGLGIVLLIVIAMIAQTMAEYQSAPPFHG